MRNTTAITLIAAVLLTGCAASTKLEYTRISAGSYVATSADNLPVLAQVPANRKVEVIGMLNLRAASSETTYEQLIAQARAKAAESGAHALLELRTGETPEAGNGRLLRTVAATVVRFLD
jgi:hypothetical protein